MPTTIDELLFRINADTRGMRQQLDLLQRRVEQTSRASTRRFDAMTAASRRLQTALALAFSAAAVRQISQVTRSSLAFANQLNDQARVIGLSAEALQEYRFAAASVGVEQRQTDTALQRFSRRIGEAAAGTGVLRNVLEDYDIALRNTDGTMRSVEAIMDDYADAVAGAESEQEQLRLANVAFDREGARLVNLIRDGSEEMRRQRQEARDLGAVLSNELVAKAAQANTRLGQLESALSTAFRAGVLEGVTEDFGTFEALMREMLPVARDLGRLIADLIPVFPQVLQVALPVIRQLFDAMTSLAGAADTVTIALGAIVGSRLGAVFGPWGAAIGGVAGGLLAAASGANAFARDADTAVARADALASAMAAIEEEADGAAGAVRQLTAETRRLAVEEARRRLEVAEREGERLLTVDQEAVDFLRRQDEGLAANARVVQFRLQALRESQDAGRISAEEYRAAVAGLSEEFGDLAVENGRLLMFNAQALSMQSESVVRLRETLERLTEPVAAPLVEGLSVDRSPSTGGGGRSSAELSNLQRTLQSVEDQAARTRLEISQLGQSAGEIERLRVEAELLAAAQADGVPITETLREQITAVAGAAGEAAQRAADMAEAAALIEAARTPQQQYTDQVQRLRDLLPELIELLGSRQAALQFVAQAEAEVGERMKEIGEEAITAQQLGQTFTDSLGRGLADIVFRGGDVLDVLNRIGERLLSLAFEEDVLGQLFDAAATVLGSLGGGGGSSGGSFGGLFAEGGVMTSRGPLPLQRYAGGGIARMPQLALFGEGSRPEAFVPLPDGRSIPVTMRGAPPANDRAPTIINIDARGADASAIAKLERALSQLDREIEPRAVRAVGATADRGRGFAKKVGRRQ